MNIQRLFFLLASVMLTSFSSLAQQFNIEGVVYEITSEENSTAMIYKVHRCLQNFEVPAKVVYNDKEYEVTKISSEAFQFLTCLYEIDLGNVTTIESGYVERSDDNRVIIYHGAFSGCTNLRAINFGKVREVGDYSFYGCTALNSLDLNNVELVGAGAFYGCRNLVELQLGNVRMIKDGEQGPGRRPNEILCLGSFGNCERLQKIHLAKVEKLGNYAFYNCIQLNEIGLGDAMKVLGTRCFAKVNNISNIKCSATIPPIYKEGAFTNRVVQNTMLQVPTGCLSVYKDATGWGSFQNIEEVDVTTIGNNNINTGIEVRGCDGSIKITGARLGDVIRIYNESGRRCFTQISTGTSIDVAISRGHIYFVKVGDIVFKISL